MMTSVLACILTYNRSALLEQCLQAVLAQERPPDGVLIVDNGSTDTTPQMLAEKGYLHDERITVLRLEDNIGASAGLEKLFRAAYATNSGWIWVMDDDVLPEPTALGELIHAYEEHFKVPTEVGYLVSAAVTPDGRANNVPGVDERRSPRHCAEWGRFLADGMIRIRNSAITSAFIPRSTLDDFGGPCSEFQIWGEDTDYTLRITEKRDAYLVGRSRVTHVRGVSGDLDIFEEVDPSRIARFYYLYRNTMYLRLRFWPLRGAVLFFGKAMIHAVRLLASREYRWQRVSVVVRGTFAGFFFQPHHVPLKANAAPSYAMGPLVSAPPPQPY
jgi:GT2 family glycosyltransferase